MISINYSLTYSFLEHKDISSASASAEADEFIQDLTRDRLQRKRRFMDHLKVSRVRKTHDIYQWGKEPCLGSRCSTKPVFTSEIDDGSSEHLLCKARNGRSD